MADNDVSVDDSADTGLPRDTKVASRTRDVATILIALTVLLGFAAFIIFLLRNLTIDDTAWARAIYLFAGVEAVAFAAGGYLFGTQVQRGNVEQAKEKANSAAQIARAASKSAASERRASKQLAQSVVDEAQRSGSKLLSGEGKSESVSTRLLVQAQRLLED